jgi:hypothetical protein
MVKYALENDDDLTIERAFTARHSPLPCLRRPILETSLQPGEPRAREQLNKDRKRDLETSNEAKTTIRPGWSS